MGCCREGLLTSLDRANARRAEITVERGKVLADVSNGRMLVADAMSHPAVRRMRAYTFLCKLPSIGPVTARGILGEVRVAEDQRLSMVGPRQRERMILLVRDTMDRKGAWSR